jgi:hypothetical protein
VLNELLFACCARSNWALTLSRGLADTSGLDILEVFSDEVNTEEMVVAAEG